MAVLVTGGAGFIGSHLCDRLLADGHDVVCLYNFCTGSKENIRHLLPNPRFELVRHDIIRYVELEVSYVYNLACPASPVHYQHDAIRTVQANVLGVTNILELARRTGARILQASTSEVYGDPQVHPQTESYWGHVNPVGLRSCYDEGKRVAETLMMDYHRQHGVDTRIARIFNTYGPRMAPDDGRVVSTLIVQALRNELLTVFGKGSQTRSFCFVEDMVDGLISLMEIPNFHEPVNLGNPEECTIIELAEMIRSMVGTNTGIRFESLPVDDPIRRRPDITRAREVLGWEPYVRLEDGLRATIGYFEKVLRTSGAPAAEVLTPAAIEAAGKGSPQWLRARTTKSSVSNRIARSRRRDQLST